MPRPITEGQAPNRDASMTVPVEKARTLDLLKEATALGFQRQALDVLTLGHIGREVDWAAAERRLRDFLRTAPNLGPNLG